jgi:hypothetical protein
MNKLRKALLEMFFIGIASGIALLATGRNANYDVFSCMLVGLLYSPLLWAAYRLLRFMFFPNRNASAGWR